ncbi:MAG: hypothetical protein WCA16_10785 [Candidatus Sulfotelmatobacter sp.]
MDLTRSPQTAAPRPSKTAPPPEPDARRLERPAPAAPAEPRKPSGYGLPCANCRLYYPADLDICPTCNSRERVPPVVAPTLPKLQASAEPMPDTEALEYEREEFLKQFKSQLVAAHAELASSPAPCSLGEHPSGEEDEAAICKPCYDRLQQRVDVCEAALHIDLKEAAQIVYDAVWADPSDPNKTYTNAANALLAELRKRAGIASLFSPFQPLAH